MHPQHLQATPHFDLYRIEALPHRAGGPHLVHRVPPHLAYRPEARQRLAALAVQLGALQHAGLHRPRELAIAAARPAHYFIGPDPGGCGLTTVACRAPDQRLDLGAALEIGRQGLDALAALARGGVSHGALCPASAWLAADGRVLIVDTGFAAAASRTDDDPEAPATTWLPEVPFMAPGVVRGDRPTPATDVYSWLGVVWSLLAGRPLFVGESVYEVALAAVAGEVPPLPGADPRLAAFFDRALDIDPAVRFGDAESAIAALEEYRVGAGVLPARELVAAVAAHGPSADEAGHPSTSAAEVAAELAALPPPGATP